MKRPYSVYKRYKQLRDKHFKTYVNSVTKICPKNCRYNVNVPFPEKGTFIRMCSLGQKDEGTLDPSKLMICSSTEQAKRCPAYSPKCRGSKDAARQMIIDHPNILESYPDLAALDWVMDNRIHELAKELDSMRWYIKSLFYMLDIIERLIVRLSSK